MNDKSNNNTDIQVFNGSLEEEKIKAKSNNNQSLPVDDKRKKLSDIARRVSIMVGQLNDTTLTQEAGLVDSLFDSPSFSVVVTGCFNRGKSTLINDLLELDLPTGNLPTTSVITHICGGDEKTLYYYDRDGNNRLTEWKEFENNDKIEDRATSGYLVYRIPSFWLEKMNMEFVDTPGTDDTEQFRKQVATNAVRSADAVIIVVSASIPLAMSERKYIEEYVYAKRIPKIAVVISMVDRIHEKERARVVDNIRCRIKSWQPGTEVWLTKSFGDQTSGDHTSGDHTSGDQTSALNTVLGGSDYIRERIQNWASDPEHFIARNNQIQTQIAQLLELCGLVVHTRLNCATTKQDTLLEMEKQLSFQVEKESLKWNELELEMERRATGISNLIAERLGDKASEMASELEKAMNNSANTGIWWEKEFPIQSSNIFGRIASDITDSLHDVIEKDFAWLNEEAGRLSNEWKSIKNAGAIDLDGEVNDYGFPDNPNIKDIRKQQLLKRAGFALAGTGAYIFFGPLGVAAALGVTWLSEQGYKNAEKEQKETICKAITSFVSYLIDSMSNEARIRLRNRYKEAVIQIRDQKRKWYDTKIATIRESTEKKHNDDEIAIFKTQLEDIQKFATELVQIDI